jgi:hypothetical protein
MVTSHHGLVIKEESENGVGREGESGNNKGKVRGLFYFIMVSSNPYGHGHSPSDCEL